MQGHTITIRESQKKKRGWSEESPGGEVGVAAADENQYPRNELKRTLMEIVPNIKGRETNPTNPASSLDSISYRRYSSEVKAFFLSHRRKYGG